MERGKKNYLVSLIEWRFIVSGILTSLPLKCIAMALPHANLGKTRQGLTIYNVYMISGDKSHPPPTNPNSQLETLRAICSELEGSGRIKGTVLKECSLKIMRIVYEEQYIRSVCCEGWWGSHGGD
jgi:hypothetical protein